MSSQCSNLLGDIGQNAVAGNRTRATWITKILVIYRAKSELLCQLSYCSYTNKNDVILLCNFSSLINPISGDFW